MPQKIKQNTNQTVNVWSEVAERVYEESQNSGYSMGDVASMIIIKFFEDGGVIPQKKNTRPSL
jgi:hypothetical protein